MAVDVLTPRARRRVERLDTIWEERPGVLGWLTTVDHKRIGLLYFFTTLAFFVAGGVEALLIRTQLARPNEKVLSPDSYNQVMTMHGVTMIFLFVIPMGVSAFGNYLVPLMIGARDMAFPRMNALSYWLFLGSGCHQIRGTRARGLVGPDLTHLMSRMTLAAGTIPNTRDELANWIIDPQAVKPGNRMPALNLTGPDFDALLAYLRSLK